MLKLIDNLLNRITMYRFVLYYLIFLVLVAAALSFFGLLPFQPADIIVSALVITAVSWVASKTFAKVFNVPANVESAYITALILALIVTPPSLSRYFSSSGLSFLIWASAWAMASKYILAIRKKHIFNPAAFAVALTALTISHSASWWIGTFPMLPFVLLGGLLVARKILRFDLVLGFFVAAFAVIIGFGLARGTDPLTTIWKITAETPILFFAFIMLTEPLTTPPTRTLRVLYGAFVGALFAPQLHIGPIYSTPELALLTGNVLSYLISPKEKYVMTLAGKIKIAPDIYDFLFLPDREMKFRPGQYLEWTRGHQKTDSRGNRRYFTIASSPAEEEVRLGVKFYPDASSFKRSMLSMEEGDEVVASQCAGDFVLPKDECKKLVFMAGGIGITPFRSMIRDLLERNEARSIIMMYSNRTAAEIVYKDVFDEAQERLGIKTIYTLTKTDQIPSDWTGARGRVDPRMIAREIPDYRERTFYLSGPRSLVVGFEEVLKNMSIPKRQIKTDFFPGFA